MAWSLHHAVERHPIHHDRLSHLPSFRSRRHHPGAQPGSGRRPERSTPPRKPRGHLFVRHRAISRPRRGGSATGIGAIWAALLARRQAQLTERSLEEQNERARLTLEFDLFSRIGERLESPHWLNTRRAAAEYLLENAFEGNEVVEVTALNTAVWEVCNLFEEIGELLRLGVLRAETVANRSGARSEAYWTLCKPAIERYRGEWKMDALYEGFEYLRQRVVEVNCERDVSALTQESIRGLLEDELGLVEEEPPPPQSEGG